MPVRQRSTAEQWWPEKTSIEKLVLKKQPFPFLSPLNVLLRWPHSCLACPRSTSRPLEDVWESVSRSSKIYLPNPWVPHCRLTSISIFYSCSMPSPSPLQHLRRSLSCWSFFWLLESFFPFCYWNCVLQSHESLICCMPSPSPPITYAFI